MESGFYIDHKLIFMIFYFIDFILLIYNIKTSVKMILSSLDFIIHKIYMNKFLIYSRRSDYKVFKYTISISINYRNNIDKYFLIIFFYIFL